jgi:hypothetical protein
MGSIEAAAKVRIQKEKLLNDISAAVVRFRDAVGLGYHVFNPREAPSGGFGPLDAGTSTGTDGGPTTPEGANGSKTQLVSTASPASDSDGWPITFRSPNLGLPSDQKSEAHFSLEADDEQLKCADSIVDYSNPDRLAQGVPLTIIAVVSKSKRERACAEFAKAIYQLPEDCVFKRPLVAILGAADSATWEDVASGRRPGPTPLIEKLLDDIENEHKLISGSPLKTPRRKNGEWVAGALQLVDENPNITNSEIAKHFNIEVSTVGRNTLFQKSKERLLLNNTRERARGFKYECIADAAVD